MQKIATPDEILLFWFGPDDAPSFGNPDMRWFQKDPAFDAEIKERFGYTHAVAEAGALDFWANERRSLMALTLLLDQFSRNMFRDDPRAFASDAHILRLVKHAIAHGLDREMPDIHRHFLYLPYEHSENLDDQLASLRLFKSLPGSEKENSGYVWAVKHYDVIAKFGRFPHRNGVLARPNTAEEDAYLSQPGAGF